MKIWFDPARRRCRHVGQILHHVIEIHDVQLTQGLAGERLDRDRHVLDVFAAPLAVTMIS